MDFTPHTDQDRAGMLEALGLHSVDELFAVIPEELRARTWDLPPPLSELEVTDHLKSLADLNAILGRAKPADLGFDIVHLNLHKTFGTPHGGGGPGAGPVGVVEKLADYLPVSRVVQRADGTFFLDYDRPKSIGYIAPFYGNFGVILKAYAYILALGGPGLKKVAEDAVLAARKPDLVEREEPIE